MCIQSVRCCLLIWGRGWVVWGDARDNDFFGHCPKSAFRVSLDERVKPFWGTTIFLRTQGKVFFSVYIRNTTTTTTPDSIWHWNFGFLERTRTCDLVFVAISTDTYMVYLHCGGPLGPGCTYTQHCLRMYLHMIQRRRYLSSRHGSTPSMINSTTLWLSATNDVYPCIFSRDVKTTLYVSLEIAPRKIQSLDIYKKQCRPDCVVLL